MGARPEGAYVPTHPTAVTLYLPEVTQGCVQPVPEHSSIHRVADVGVVWLLLHRPYLCTCPSSLRVLPDVAGPRPTSSTPHRRFHLPRYRAK